ncbi:MAG: 16S rRNA (guanine527-N7)-methyltransferase [Kiritimatiellia bacterium]|jgi:16S rRNA (guanine527-N7)-methyltransferase
MTLAPPELELLTAYLECMLETGSHTNLTAVRDAPEAWMRHFFDALSLVPFIEPAQSLMDIGTGAGIPGMVLAICRPDCSFTLVDAVDKKCRFLAEVAEKLTISNVTVLHARAEDVGRDLTLRESSDLVLARAVSELAVLLEFCLPLVKVGGRFLAMKGERYRDELEAAAGAMQALEIGAPEVHPAVSGPGAQLIFTKELPTPDRFPRRAGMPKKRPL